MRNGKKGTAIKVGEYGYHKRVVRLSKRGLRTAIPNRNAKNSWLLATKRDKSTDHSELKEEIEIANKDMSDIYFLNHEITKCNW